MRASSVLGRSSAFLARQARIRACNSSPTPAPRPSIGGGGLETCWLATSMGVPVKGGSPVAAW
nr:hypothetical protein [Rubrobacter tropicus]